MLWTESRTQVRIAWWKAWPSTCRQQPWGLGSVTIGTETGLSAGLSTRQATRCLRSHRRFQATPGRKHPLESMLNYILISKRRITGVKTENSNISVSKKPTTKGKPLRHWNTNNSFLDNEINTSPKLGWQWVYLQQRLINLFIWNKHVSLSDPSNCWTNRALCLIRFWYIHIWKSKTYNSLDCKKLTVL